MALIFLVRGVTGWCAACEEQETEKFRLNRTFFRIPYDDLAKETTPKTASSLQTLDQDEGD